MKKPCMVAALAGLLAAAGAWADGDVIRSQSLEVKERLGHLERIDVTAEKPKNENAEPLDEELLAILEDAEQAEQQTLPAREQR